MTVLVGLVLAGGRSRRFGSEKALALFGATPLLDLAVARLSRDCAEVGVNAPSGSGAARRAAEIGRPLIPDVPGDPDGPLAGIKAGLAWAAGRGADALALVPCDAPLLPDELISALLDGLSDALAAVAETADGMQPLCALWRVALLDDLTTAMAGGRHPPVHRLLDDLGARRVRFPDRRAFLNVNTQAELRAAHETARPRQPY